MSKAISDKAIRKVRHRFVDNPVGIWIDAHEAHVIRLQVDGHELTIVRQNPAFHRDLLRSDHRDPGFGIRLMTLERREQERLEHERSAYLHRVMEVMGQAKRVVVFGPAGMKYELQQMLAKDVRWRRCQLNVVTAEKMTPNQRVAWVKRYFH